VQCTGYMLPSGILLVMRIMFIPRFSGASQAFNAVLASTDPDDHDDQVRDMYLPCISFSSLVVSSMCLVVQRTDMHL